MAVPDCPGHPVGTHAPKQALDCAPSTSDVRWEAEVWCMQVRYPYQWKLAWLCARGTLHTWVSESCHEALLKEGLHHCLRIGGSYYRKSYYCLPVGKTEFWPQLSVLPSCTSPVVSSMPASAWAIIWLWLPAILGPSLLQSWLQQPCMLMMLPMIVRSNFICQMQVDD